MATTVRKLTQTGHPRDEPDLETLRDNLPIFTGDEPEQIVDAFDAGLKSLAQPSPSASVDEAAQALFTEIQRVLPLTEDKSRNAFLFENLATLFMRTAHQTPSRHIGQELLVSTVGLIYKSPDERWRNGFPEAQTIRMRDGWNGFTLEDGHEVDEVQTPDEWLNLNSFNARLLGSGITPWINFPIWQLREGLEDVFGPDTHENDCKIAVASEWIIQAGPKLLRHALLNEELDEDLKRSYSGLQLWTGLPGLNTERWGFWKRRLAEVKPGVKTQLTSDYVEHAQRVMTKVEKDLAASIK